MAILTTPGPDPVQTLFLDQFPRFCDHARFAFRHVRCPATRDDQVAESLALAWRHFVALLARGKNPTGFVTVLALRCSQAVKAGRRLDGSESPRDVLSPLAASTHLLTRCRYHGDAAYSSIQAHASSSRASVLPGSFRAARKGDVEAGTAPTDSAARSSLSGWYDLDATPANEAALAVEDVLNPTVTGGRASMTDSMVSGPNLFVLIGPSVDFLGRPGRDSAGRMRDLLFQMTLSQNCWEWGERAKVVDAVVRALLREDILLRLPRSVFQDTEETWASSILRGLHEPPGRGPREPLAGRVEEFLRELAEMGPTEREAHLRYAMNPHAEAVKLVSGESGIDRDAVFKGFNTPLLPDILVCTQVGQEGIDLHRHCSHVVHYDLGWNPATIEQRTGRTDRLGSKALRERKLAVDEQKKTGGLENSVTALPGLDIALPYLAGTY